MSAWASWAVYRAQGFGVFRFFFGWRTLGPRWHTFFRLWQIGDSIMCLGAVMAAIGLALAVVAVDGDGTLAGKAAFGGFMSLSTARYPAVPLGSVLMLMVAWRLILWTELIVAGNNTESDTDMIAVWLFVAQVGAMMVPSLACFKRKGNSSAG